MHVQDNSQQHTCELQSSTSKWVGRKQMLLPDAMKKHSQYYKKCVQKKPGTKWYLKDKQDVLNHG